MTPLRRQPRPGGDPTAWVAATRLAFGNAEATPLIDLESLHEKLSLAINLRSIEPRGRRELLAQRSALRLAGDIGLTAVASTPTVSQVDDHHEAVMAVLSQGRIDYRIANRDWTARGGLTAVYLPGEAMRVRADHHVGLAFNLNPPLLARYLVDLDPGLALEAAMACVQRPWTIDLTDPAVIPALQHLDLVTRLLDVSAIAQPSSSILNLLQERLYQLSARFLQAARAAR